jgi:HD-like signal output (HDOD) protein
MNLELEFEERVARRTVRLLPHPRTAARLSKLVADPNHSLTQVVNVAKLDPLLAGAVLRVANAADHSHGAPTCSLATAITRIGAEELARLAVAAGLGGSPSHSAPVLELRPRLMRRALTSALICERLAPEYGLDPERLFLDGLLHDVGSLMALATLELMFAQQPRLPQVSETWLALAQTHHVELGSLLGERWGLPAEVCRAITRHHAPDDGARDAVSLVRLSDELLGLVDDGGSMSEAQHAWLAGIDPARRVPLLEALTGIPAVVAALEAGREVPPALWLVAPVTQTGAVQRFPVRVRGGHSGEVQLLAPGRLLLRLTSQLRDNHLEEMEVALPDGPLKLWLRVTRGNSIGADGRAEAEAVPFAITELVASRLQEWASPGPAERAA